MTITQQKRHYSWVDHCIGYVDQALKATCGKPIGSERRQPGQDIAPPTLTPSQTRHVAGLMRVNHAGEIAAQGLYHGQALTAQLSEVREQMQAAAEEESDHLLWCEQRLTELSSHTSYLGPLWYGGAFAMGALAGFIGDKWSLGFVKETEDQVTAHLNKHLAQLPENDDKSRAIVSQMREDEMEHATKADAAGAAKLPGVIRFTMHCTAKVMTRTAYWI